MVQKTALYDRHVALGARLVDFAGWTLPVQYPTGPLKEHICVRQAAGLFDIDHMGQVIVRGPDALAFLQRVMTADVQAFSVGTANYSLMCYEDGGVVDDTFIYRLPDHYFVAINASNSRKDTRWLNWQCSGYDVIIDNVSVDTCMLALQGPRAEAILQRLCDGDLSELSFHECAHMLIAGVRTLVGRTGYTGEDGFELFFPTGSAGLIWDRIMASGEPDGLLPIGLAARDSLRLEPCMPLYGQEISAEVNPIEAGLSWALSFDKPDWIGRGALIKTRLEGRRRKAIGFELTEGGVPRHGCDVVVDGCICGEVTSGIYSPTLGKPIGLALVTTDIEVGQSIAIRIRRKDRGAIVVRRPFYTPAYRRDRAR